MEGGEGGGGGGGGFCCSVFMVLGLVELLSNVLRQSIP